MEKYIINYQTGITEEVEADELVTVKADAQQGMNYTQQHVTIEDADGTVIARSLWYGYKPTDYERDEGLVLEEIGGGFYGSWEDDI